MSNFTFGKLAHKQAVELWIYLHEHSFALRSMREKLIEERDKERDKEIKYRETD